MNRAGFLLNKMVPLLLFVILQGAAMVLITKNSIYQQAYLLHYLREVQYLFWERQASVGAYFHLQSSNEHLVAENLLLRSELSKYLYDSTSTVPADSIFSFATAEVIRNSTNRHQNYIIINKGSKDGVKADMGIISDQGAVGVVSNVSPRYAMVISLLNTHFHISARIEPSQATGTLTWKGQNIRTVNLSEVPQHSEVQVGDTVVTSGYSQIFPPRIPIGKVTKTTIKQGSFLDVEIALFQNFNTLRYVNIVQNLHKQEIDTLTQSNER